MHFDQSKEHLFIIYQCKSQNISLFGGKCLYFIGSNLQYNYTTLICLMPDASCWRCVMFAMHQYFETEDFVAHKAYMKYALCGFKCPVHRHWIQQQQNRNQYQKRANNNVQNLTCLCIEHLFLCSNLLLLQHLCAACRKCTHIVP